MKVPVSRMSAVGMFNKPVFPMEYCARITVQQKNRKNSNKYFFYRHYTSGEYATLLPVTEVMVSQTDKLKKTKNDTNVYILFVQNKENEKNVFILPFVLSDTISLRTSYHELP